LGQPDYKRWSSPECLEESWDERTKQLAQLVPPGSRLIEFGAGRRQLQNYLPPGCTYIPSDLVNRGPDTIVCDLNERPLPSLWPASATVAVFGGVLEYIRDVPGLVRWLADQGVKTCVASFDTMPTGLTVIGRCRELFRRSYNGYMNSLTEQELLTIFKTVGFECMERQTWHTQIITQFVIGS